MNGYKAILDATKKRLEALVIIYGYIPDVDVRNTIKEIERLEKAVEKKEPITWNLEEGE